MAKVAVVMGVKCSVGMPLGTISSSVRLCIGSRRIRRSLVLAVLVHSPTWAQYAADQSAPAAPGSRGLLIQPSLSISEVFSDNVSLAPAGAAKSEWTTRIRPAVTITENGPRLRFNATYSPELLYRAIAGDSGVNHFLNAYGNTELVQRLLYVDVRANVTQQNVSVLAPQSDSNLNTTGNRTTVKTYSISPYLRYDFGYDATGELRFTHDAVSFGGNSNGSSASTSDRISAQLASGPSFQLFRWGFAYSKAHIEYTQTGQKIDSQNVSATGGRLIVPDLRVSATVGYEDSGYPTSGGRVVKGTFWNIGPTWTPTPRTNVSATVGRRYFGPTKNFHLDHRFARTVLELDYGENVITTRSSLSIPMTQDTATLLDNLFKSQTQFQDPVVRQAAVQAFIAANGLPANLAQPVNFLTDSLFLEKRWRAALGVKGVRNTVLTSLFSSNRTAITSGGPTSGDFNSSQSVKQTGATASWSLQVTKTLAANTNLSVTRNEIPALSGTDRLSLLRFSLTEQFSPKLTGSLLVGRSKNNSNRSGGTSYTENSISATLGLRF